MRTFDERKQSVQGYLKKAKGRKRALTALKVTANIACVLAIIVAIMHIPYGSISAGGSPTNPFAHPTTTGPFTNEPTVDEWPTHGPVPTYPIGTTVPTVPYSTEVGTLPPEPEVTVELNIWVPDDNTAWMVNYHVNSFNAAGGIRGVRIVPNISVVVPDQVSVMLMEEPPENQPHLICTDQTVVRYLARLDMLTPYLGDDAEEIAGKNDALSVKAASYGGNIYATPLYHKDGYFLYYDSSVISPGDVGSLECLISACEAARKNFCFDLSNPYYQASFFLGAGWYSYWYQDAKGDFTSYRDNLNSDVGMIGLQGMTKLLNSPCYITPGNTNIAVEDAYSQAAVIVAGPWEYERIKTFMGENMKTAKLPTFEVEGESYQLGSFANTVMAAVPILEDMELAFIATRLALFLSYETNQIDYWCEWGYIPTNISAQSDLHGTGDVDPFLTQSHYAKPMETYPEAWWEFFEQLPSELISLSFRKILDRYQQTMDAVFTPEGPYWTLSGEVNCDFWDRQIMLVPYESGGSEYLLSEAIYLEEDSEFYILYVDPANLTKILYGADGKDGCETFRPGLVGYYYVEYNVTTGQIAFIPQTSIPPE